VSQVVAIDARPPIAEPASAETAGIFAMSIASSASKFGESSLGQFDP
jgi:hypothetical protein